MAARRFTARLLDGDRRPVETAPKPRRKDATIYHRLRQYRRRQFQDSFLPDEGVAVYVVDESIDDVNDEDELAIEPLQADGDLAGICGTGNPGDVGDLYPYRRKRTLGRSTKPASRLPDGHWSGVTLKVKVQGRHGDPTMTLDVALA